MVDFFCPICGNSLGDNEGIFITRDTIGSLVVWHAIPEDVPATPDNLRENILKSPTRNLVPGYDKMRNCCGKARFKKVVIT